MRVLTLGVLVVGAALAGAGLAAGRGDAGAQGRPHVHGVAQLRLSIAGPEVEAEFFAPGSTLVGFEHAPESDMEVETLRLARENLKAGDAMIRFNTNAACRLVKAKVDTEMPALARGADADGPSAEQAHADISAYYRFACLQPQELESAALGVFTGFPAIQRVLVHYEMPEGRGAAELTRTNPVVAFIPF